MASHTEQQHGVCVEYGGSDDFCFSGSDEIWLKQLSTTTFAAVLWGEEGGASGGALWESEMTNVPSAMARRNVQLKHVSRGFRLT